MRSRGAAAGLESWAPRRAKPPPPPARRPPIAARGSAERSVYAPLIWIRSRGGCLQRKLLPSRWSAAPRRRCRNSCRTFEWRFRSGRQVWVWGGLQMCSCWITMFWSGGQLLQLLGRRARVALGGQAGNKRRRPEKPNQREERLRKPSDSPPETTLPIWRREKYRRFLGNAEKNRKRCQEFRSESQKVKCFQQTSTITEG